ncbi:MAG TPA: hypothetical protein VI387_06520 [Candidatus Brocadiales bacterium]|nr:hypothetical protein [Candidatus Brocadiales bacterium]
MKSFSLIKALGTLVVLVAVVTLLGSSVYGEAPALKIPVIQGTVTDIEMENGYLLIQGSDILGSDPLYLGSDTCVFKGYEGVNFDELNRNAKAISALDSIELSDLNIGCEVCCTYTYSKDGKLIADNIVMTKPSTEVPSM